jgi:hypothetical protein
VSVSLKHQCLIDSASCDALAVDTDNGVLAVADSADQSLRREDQGRVGAFLAVAMLTLPPVQQRILSGVYGVDQESKTIPHLAVLFCMSVEDVQKQHDQALRHMRRFICENRIPPRTQTLDL